MEWELRRLAHCTYEEQEAGPERVLAQRTLLTTHDNIDNIVEPERPDGDRHDDDSEEEACVRDLVHHERLVRSIDVVETLPVVADQQIRRNTDKLPADDQLDEVWCRDQHKHSTSKQGERSEEPGEAHVTLHIAVGIGKDEESNNTDEEVHHDRQAVNHPSPLKGQVANLSDLHRPLVHDAGCRVDDEEHGSIQTDKPDRSPRNLPALERHLLAPEHDHERCHKRNDNNQPCPLDKGATCHTGYEGLVTSLDHFLDLFGVGVGRKDDAVEKCNHRQPFIRFSSSTLADWRLR